RSLPEEEPEPYADSQRLSEVVVSGRLQELDGGARVRRGSPEVEIGAGRRRVPMSAPELHRTRRLRDRPLGEHNGGAFVVGPRQSRKQQKRLAAQLARRRRVDRALDQLAGATRVTRKAEMLAERE